jgi:DNA-binding MarR family transcriptional regulator
MAKQQQRPQPERASELAHDLRAVLGRLKRRLREQAHPGDVTGSQISVVLRLEREGAATVTHLARAEGVRPQSLGATIAGLEAAGLVRGAPDPSDGRQTMLSLTPACRDLIQTGRTARQDWLHRAIATTLTPAEQQQLAAATELLRRLADS